MKFIQKIGALIEDYVNQSTSINIAVALASQTAIDILENAPNKCKVRFVIGTYLPTPLIVLKSLKKNYGYNARIYNSELFHPKVYLFTLSDGTKKVILGSGNFTNGGLHDNIEAAVLVEESDIIEDLENWFQTIYMNSQPITDKFLANYKDYADGEIRHRTNRRKHLNKLQPQLDIYNDIRKETIKLLRHKMKNKKFIEIINERSEVVKQLQKYVDLANHFKNFDIDNFFKIYELGTIPPIYKSYLMKAKQDGRLAKVLNMLIDENIPLNKRVDTVLNKESKIKGIGINFLSKILCVYNQNLYVIWNEPTEKFFNTIGLKPDKGLTRGEQYQFYCNFFRSICKEAGVPDMAVLDALILDEQFLRN